MVPLSYVAFLRGDKRTTVKTKNRIYSIDLIYSSPNHFKKPKQEEGHYQKHGIVFLSDQ